MLQFIDLFRGGKSAKTIKGGRDQLPGYGVGTDYTRTDAERLFIALISKGILKEALELNGQGFVLSYVRTGPKAAQLLDGRMRLDLWFSGEPRTVTSARRPKTAGAAKSRRRSDATDDMSSISDSDAEGWGEDPIANSSFPDLSEAETPRSPKPRSKRKAGPAPASKRKPTAGACAAERRQRVVARPEEPSTSGVRRMVSKHHS